MIIFKGKWKFNSKSPRVISQPVVFNPTELPLPVVEVEGERLVGANDGGGFPGDGSPVEEDMLDVHRVGEEEGGGLGPRDKLPGTK